MNIYVTIGAVVVTVLCLVSFQDQPPKASNEELMRLSKKMIAD